MSFGDAFIKGYNLVPSLREAANQMEQSRIATEQAEQELEIQRQEIEYERAGRESYQRGLRAADDYLKAHNTARIAVQEANSLPAPIRPTVTANAGETPEALKARQDAAQADYDRQVQERNDRIARAQAGVPRPEQFFSGATQTFQAGGYSGTIPSAFDVSATQAQAEQRQAAAELSLSKIQNADGSVSDIMTPEEFAQRKKDQAELGMAPWGLVEGSRGGKPFVQVTWKPAEWVRAQQQHLELGNQATRDRIESMNLNDAIKLATARQRITAGETQLMTPEVIGPQYFDANGNVDYERYGMDQDAATGQMWLANIGGLRDNLLKFVREKYGSDVLGSVSALRDRETFLSNPANVALIARLNNEMNIERRFGKISSQMTDGAMRELQDLDGGIGTNDAEEYAYAQQMLTRYPGMRMTPEEVVSAAHRIALAKNADDTGRMLREIQTMQVRQAIGNIAGTRVVDRMTTTNPATGQTMNTPYSRLYVPASYDTVQSYENMNTVFSDFRSKADAFLAYSTQTGADRNWGNIDWDVASGDTSNLLRQGYLVDASWTEEGLIFDTEHAGVARNPNHTGPAFYDVRALASRPGMQQLVEEWDKARESFKRTSNISNERAYLLYTIQMHDAFVGTIDTNPFDPAIIEQMRNRLNMISGGAPASGTAAGTGGTQRTVTTITTTPGQARNMVTPMPTVDAQGNVVTYAPVPADEIIPPPAGSPPGIYIEPPPNPLQPSAPTPSPSQAPPAAAPTTAAGQSYTVAPGDSLSRIARRMLGSENRWREIFDANRDTIANPNAISVGQVIRIPGVGSAQAPAAPAPAQNAQGMSDRDFNDFVDRLTEERLAQYRAEGQVTTRESVRKEVMDALGNNILLQ